MGDPVKDDLPQAHEVPWPPPPGLVYSVHSSHAEVFAEGATDGAEITRVVPGYEKAFGRGFIVTKDRWNEDHTVRTILKVKRISER